MAKIKLNICVYAVFTAFLSAPILFAEAEWEPLFNGKNLSGWTATDPKKFKVEDGLLIGFQNDGKGADWLSKENVVKNPYYGSMMLGCGKVTETIK